MTSDLQLVNPHSLVCCLSISLWLSAFEYAGSRDFAFVGAVEICWSLRSPRSCNRRLMHFPMPPNSFCHLKQARLSPWYFCIIHKSHSWAEGTICWCKEPSIYDVHKKSGFWLPSLCPHGPVCYENLSAVVIRPDKSRHKYRWSE